MSKETERAKKYIIEKYCHPAEKVNFDSMEFTDMNELYQLLTDFAEQENKDKITIQKAIEIIHEIFDKFITFDSEDERSNFVIELAAEFKKRLNNG